VFGGTMTDSRPLATYALIAVCVVVWLVQKADPSFTDKFEFAPFAASHRPWTFLTAAFLHSPSNYFHILFNMYALWVCGQYLEPLLGRVRFVALYLVSALGGSVGFLLLAPPTLLTVGNQPAWWTPTVGASGAVFGLFAALVILNRKLGRSSAGIYAVIVINAVIGFLPGEDIAWQAHLGGLVTGALVAAALVFAPRDRRAVAQWAGLGGVLVLLVIITAVKFGTVPADVSQQASVFLGAG
jgi:membrane associated rhomboid family serine protease